MPSACVKLDKKSPADTEEAIKQCLSVVEKKVRNLEKRKGKLDSYREQYEKAEDSLNEDQKDAISKYDSVLRNLEFARELQKQFHDINDKAEKLLKKKEKYDKQVKHNEEVARVRELLQVQGTLDNMGVENVRNDFKSGKRGAVVVSEASLDQLDELYKLISPSRDGDVSYMEQLTTASEHIVNLLDGREKEVAGTTYKELKDLISKINQCGYFENSASEEDSTEETAEQEPEVTEKSEENQTKFEEEVSDAAPATQTAPLTFKDPQLTTSTEQPLPPQVQSMSTAIQDPSTASYSEEDQDSFFSTVQMGRPRGFQEIVSSVQGSFDFLQESEIEKNKQQKEVPHVDPAVVAAHPMGVHQSDPLSQSYGSAAGFSLDDQTTKSYTPQQPQNVAGSTDQTKSQFDAISAPSVTQSQSSQFAAQNSNFETTQSETWNQRKQETRWSTATDGMERSWGASDQSASQPQKWGDTATPTTSQNTQSWADQAATPNQSWGDQGSQGWSTGGGQRAQLNNNQETKTSSLNPNADIFMYQNQTGNFPQDGRSSNFEGGSRKDDGFSDGFQSQGYRGRRDYDGNRGFRGNRGGPRGNTNSNGYSRGGNRGGYRGGDDRRGGYSDRGNRGGNRGGMRGGPRGGRGRGGGSYNSRPSSAQHQQ